MTRIAPSKIWFSFVSFLWKRVPTRDRFVILGSFLLPAANRITTLMAFGVTIKGLTQVLYSPLSPTKELILGGTIFAAFLISEATAVVMGITDASIQRICRTLARGLRADELILSRNLSGPSEVQAKVRSRSKKEGSRNKETYEDDDLGLDDDVDEQENGGGVSEKDFVIKAGNLFQNLTRFVSVVVLLFALLLVIGWIAPILSLVITVGGGGLLLFLRSRIRPRSVDNGAQKKAKKQLAKLEKKLLTAKKVTEGRRLSYIHNRHDQLLFEMVRAKRLRRGKITALGGIGAAFAMMIVFFLATKGFMREVDPAALVVLILAFRLCVGQGKAAIDKWSVLLSERELLAELRKMVDDSSKIENHLDLERGEGKKGVRQKVKPTSEPTK